MLIRKCLCKSPQEFVSICVSHSPLGLNCVEEDTKYEEMKVRVSTFKKLRVSANQCKYSVKLYGNYTSLFDS